MTQLEPCRCCGEAEHLIVNEEFHSEDWAFTADNQIKRDPRGAYSVGCVDYVECLICNTTSPLEHWNNTKADWPARRAATLAAWVEAERASDAVLGYLREMFGKEPHPLDSWKKTGIRTKAPTVLQRLERAAGLPITPRDDHAYWNPEDIINALAGRLPPSVIHA